MKKRYFIFGALTVVSICYGSYLIGVKIQNTINERKEKVINKFNNNENLYCRKGANAIEKNSGPLHRINNKEWEIREGEFVNKKNERIDLLDCNQEVK